MDPYCLWLVWYPHSEEEMEDCWSATSVLSAASFLAAASRLPHDDPLAGGVLNNLPTDGDLVNSPPEDVLGRVPLEKLS